MALGRGPTRQLATEMRCQRRLSSPAFSPAEDFNQARRRSNVEGLEGDLGTKGEVEEVLPDGRLDHPTSTENIHYGDADQEIAKGVTGYGSEELDTGFVETTRTAQQVAGKA